MRTLKSSLLLYVVAVTVISSCNSNTSAVTPIDITIASPAVLPTATFTSTPEPTLTPSITPTNIPIPTISKTRINLSSELYVDENSSLDNLGEINHPNYSYFRNDVWGYVYNFEDEEWVITQPETCIFPSSDFNCDSHVEDTLRAYYVQLWKDRELIYSLPVNFGVQPHTFLRYEDHWIFSFGNDWDNKGWIVQDGIILNDLYDYDTAFSLFLLDDKPFFFFQRGDQFGISFDNEEILLPYPNISFGPICCDNGGAGHWNPRASNTKVGFYVKRGEAEYQYIEIGLREGDL